MGTGTAGVLTLGDLLGLVLTGVLILISLISIYRRNGNSSTAQDARMMSGAWQTLVQEQRREIAILRELASLRGEQLERARIEPATHAQAESIYETIRDLAEAFSVDELDTLMLSIDIKPDSIRGDTIEERARELVLAADRRGRLEALIRSARRERPRT
jgi:hypothetical protein